MSTSEVVREAIWKYLKTHPKHARPEPHQIITSELREEFGLRLVSALYSWGRKQHT